jgi:ATPase subunit of ABC transporter with duplicated ATPase domains
LHALSFLDIPRRFLDNVTTDIIHYEDKKVFVAS